MESSKKYLTPELFMENLNSPVDFVTDNLNNFYIVEQYGIIWRIDNNQLTPFLDFREQIGDLDPSYSEFGLLSLAFPPENSGRFFIYYAIPVNKETKSYEIRLSEITVTTEKILLRIPKNETNHNGGKLLFGPDGFLYIGIGDLGGAKDLHANSQNLSSLGGKILRLNVNKPGEYSIPDDNPFINYPGARKEIYALGLRNPWRMSFNDKGRLWVGDVGQDRIESIDIITKGGNYGWNLFEGSQPANWPIDPQYSGREFTTPVFEYTHQLIQNIFKSTKIPIAIIGGYYINDDIGYIFGDLSKLLMRVKLIKDKYTLVEIFQISEYIKSFGQDQQGNLYVLTSEELGPKGQKGKIYKLELF
jgi:hypothetical protein